MSEAEDDIPFIYETVDEFSSDVKACLNRQELIRETLSEIYKGWNMGEKSQSNINSFLDKEDCLFRIAISANNEIIDSENDFFDLLDLAVENDLLEEAEKSMMEELWSEISWINDAVVAYYYEDAWGSKYWTEIDMNLIEEDGDLLIDLDLISGLETENSYRMLLELFSTDAVGRMMGLITQLEQKEELELGPNQVHVLNYASRKMSELSSDMEDIVKAKGTEDALSMLDEETAEEEIGANNPQK